MMQQLWAVGPLGKGMHSSPTPKKIVGRCGGKKTLVVLILLNDLSTQRSNIQRDNETIAIRRSLIGIL